MVALPRQVNVEAEAGGGNLPLIPSGQYQALVVASELKSTKTGGQMVVFDIVITQGAHAHTEFKEYVNIVNNSEDAVRIGYQTIANIGKALGLANVTTTEELHNKPLMIEVGKEDGKPWVDSNGVTREGKDKSVIKKFLPIPSGGAPTPQPEAAQPEATTAAQPAAATVNTPKDNPFAKPA